VKAISPSPDMASHPVWPMVLVLAEIASRLSRRVHEERDETGAADAQPAPPEDDCAT
jgi:hypothetical protein